MIQRPFKPLFKNPHLQTIIASKCNLPRYITSQTYDIPTTEGDQLTCDLITPPAITNKHLSIILHGLCGSSHATYVTRLTKQLRQQGMTIACLNFRGCNKGPLKAKGLAHSGRSEDLAACLQFIKSKYPDYVYSIVGFSLGGNIALKFAAELTQQDHLNIRQIIAICPPVDLTACANMMEHPKNRIFRRYFSKHLNKIVQKRHLTYPELGPAPIFSRNVGFWQFDESYTAPQSGFKSAQDYFNQCSTIDQLDQIALPCHILMAADDPFIDHTKIARKTLPKNIHYHQTDHGGHLGFLANPLAHQTYRWLDKQITAWILQCPQHQADF